MILGHAAELAAVLAVRDDVAVQAVSIARLQQELTAQRQKLSKAQSATELQRHLAAIATHHLPNSRSGTMYAPYPIWRVWR